MAERTAESILKDIQEYRTYLDKRAPKYRRNFNRYTTNGARNEDIWNLYGNPLGYFYNTSDEDIGPIPMINVIRSCIETHVSKISQTKVRPYFTPRNGNFKTFKVAENAQTFFDQYYIKQDIYKQATEALRDSEIFEYGLLWVDEQNTRIQRVRPWQFYFDPAEFNYSQDGKYLTRCFIEYRTYPLTLLLQSSSKDSIPENIMTDYNNYNDLKVKWNIYYDLVNKQRVEFINDIFIRRTELESSVVPFEFIWYSNPIKGANSTSLVDNLRSIQDEIDMLSRKIHEAFSLSPANSIFIPNGTLGKQGTIKKSMISAKIGNLYEYDASIPGNGQFVVSTPRPIDESYKDLLEFYVMKAYEMEGISQLSSQSKVNSNIQSGVMLDTLQDVESERHQVILDNYRTMLMHIAEKMIDIFPKDALVLPKRIGVKNVTWNDIKTEKDNYSLEFTPASALSNDAMTKMEEVEKLISMGVIKAPMANKLLEFPDIQFAFNVTNSSYDDIQAIIERAIEKEEYDFYEIINLQELYSETASMIMRLDSNGENLETIGRLVTLLNKVKHQMDELNQVANPPNTAPPPPPVPLMGPQITAILEVLDQVKQGTLNVGTAVGLLSLAIPGQPADAIKVMVEANSPGGTPPPTPPGNAGQAGPPPSPLTQPVPPANPGDQDLNGTPGYPASI